MTHKSVYLTWVPGFHGGSDQYFRFRYQSDRDLKVRYADVYPANADSGLLSDLDAGAKYSISLMSLNNIGESNYTATPIFVRTASEYKSDYKSRAFYNCVFPQRSSFLYMSI